MCDDGTVRGVLFYDLCQIRIGVEVERLMRWNNTVCVCMHKGMFMQVMDIHFKVVIKKGLIRHIMISALH